MSEPIWVLPQVVTAIHKRQLAEHGGGGGVRAEGLLASGLARPQHLFTYSEGVKLTRLAAAYAFGIVRNHPFIDGNKRTAFVVAMLFLHLNGYTVTAPQEEKYKTFMALADGSLSEEALAEWLENHLRPSSAKAPNGLK
jgi:death-on-curing protein